MKKPLLIALIGSSALALAACGESAPDAATTSDPATAEADGAVAAPDIDAMPQESTGDNGTSLSIAPDGADIEVRDDDMDVSVSTDDPSLSIETDR